MTTGCNEASARQVAIVNTPSTSEVRRWIESEDDLHDLTPARALRLCIEQPQVEAGMLSVVIGNVVAHRCFVEEVESGHVGEVVSQATHSYKKSKARPQMVGRS